VIPKAIILEGVDGVGKSSVRILISNYNGNHFVLERFTPSIYAYGRFYKRGLDPSYIASLEEALQSAFDVCPVFLKCSPDVLYERFKTGRHVVELTASDLELLQDMMEDYVDNFSILPWMKIDNTNITPQAIFEKIREVFRI